MTGRQVRSAARAGTWRETTRGAAPGHVQCNVVILPEREARAFAQWCELNPSVAPVLGRSEPGDPRLPALGDIDLRHDLPAYRLFEHGVATGHLFDLVARWTDDLVGFAFGCSFSLEDALRREGVDLAYEQRGFGGAIYRTSVPTTSHAGFDAPLIVSMRPIAEDAVPAALAVSKRYPHLHGEPVHTGDPTDIGVDLAQPLDTLGDVSVGEGEIPVFWACGVTTQAAIERARPPVAYTHVSSRMLVCDLLLDDLVVAPA
jgi:uncharacterized protein YcsI (UPF0317 family)